MTAQNARPAAEILVTIGVPRLMAPPRGDVGIPRLCPPPVRSPADDVKPNPEPRSRRKRCRSPLRNPARLPWDVFTSPYRPSRRATHPERLSRSRCWLVGRIRKRCPRLAQPRPTRGCKVKMVSSLEQGGLLGPWLQQLFWRPAKPPGFGSAGLQVRVAGSFQPVAQLVEPPLDLWGPTNRTARRQEKRAGDQARGSPGTFYRQVLGQGEILTGTAICASRLAPWLHSLHGRLSLPANLRTGSTAGAGMLGR
jgi:hypothetical protein